MPTNFQPEDNSSPIDQGQGFDFHLVKDVMMQRGNDKLAVTIERCAKTGKGRIKRMGDVVMVNGYAECVAYFNASIILWKHNRGEELNIELDLVKEEEN